MNNEPVAWIGKDELQFGFTDTRVTNEKESWDDIPLYTNPAKTLTELSGVEIIGMSGKYDFNYEVDIIDFARAIIKKASE